MDFLSTVGALSLAYIAFKLARLIFVYFLRPPKSFEKYRGTWAVVTGASWGVGYGFCKQLAKRGVNIVLISRTKERLEEVAKELEGKYKIKTRVLTFDFDTQEATLYDTLNDKTKDLKVTILVNNVGMYYNYMKYFDEVSASEIDQIIRVNINSQSHMTRVFLPRFLEQKSGAIITVSSESSVPDLPTGWFTVYAATKAYNDKFSRSLSDEYVGKGVEFLSITPGFVTSKMTGSRQTNPIMCSEDIIAGCTLDKLGYQYWSISPWFNHLLFTLSMSHFGQLLRTNRVSYILSKRASGIKKMEEKKKK